MHNIASTQVADGIHSWPSDRSAPGKCGRAMSAPIASAKSQNEIQANFQYKPTTIAIRRRELGDRRPLEFLVQAQGPFIVAEVIGEDRQRRLRRPRAAIAPTRSRSGWVDEIEAQLERPGERRAVPAHLDRIAVSAAIAGIDLLCGRARCHGAPTTAAAARGRAPR